MHGSTRVLRVKKRNSEERILAVRVRRRARAAIQPGILIYLAQRDNFSIPQETLHTMSLHYPRRIKLKHQTAPLHVVDSTATEVLVRCNADFAVTHYQHPNDDITEDLLNDLLEIPPKIYCPKAQDWFIRAPEAVPVNWFIKYPQLTLSDDNPKSRFLREVLVCETLAEHPHPNVARYHGVIVQDGLVRGICYESYPYTLKEKVNLGDLSKADFQYSSKHPLKDRVAFLEGIRAGVAHLHSLGLVHNDLKPSNIMIKDDEDETPIIVDFDSCALEGTPSSEVGRSLGWHEPGGDGVRASDDDKAIEEIEKWLNDMPIALKGYAFGVKEVLSTGEGQAVKTKKGKRSCDERLLDVDRVRDERVEEVGAGEEVDGRSKDQSEGSGAKKVTRNGKKQKRRRKGKKVATKVPAASSTRITNA